MFCRAANLISAVLLLITLAAAAAGAPILSDIQFGQRDWYAPGGALVAPDSLWGYLSFAYTPDVSQTYYLNASASIGGPSQWVVQNVPLFPSGSGLARLGLDVDLGEFGISSGTPLTSIDLLFSVDSGIQISPPAGSSSNYLVQDLVQYAWMDLQAGPPGEPFTDPGSPKGSKHTAEPETKPADRDIEALQEEEAKCFPGATARSLSWLNRKYKLGVNKTVEKIYQEIRDKVKNAQYAKDGIKLKDEYARDTFKTVITKVYDQMDVMDPIKGVKETTPKDESLTSWLEREYKTEDVELVYRWVKKENNKETDVWHIVTIVSVFKDKAGKNWVRYRDDENQGNDTAGDKEAKERELYLKDGVWRFGSDGNSVGYLLSESVPEPASLLLAGLGLGLLPVGARLRRRLRRR